MHKQMEHQEHAEHAAHSGSQKAALLVTALAAALAITEQGAKHAEIRVQENSILAADLWNEYQGKSVRLTTARYLEKLEETEDGGSPETVQKRQAFIASLKSDESHFEHDPDSGRDALAKRARGMEAARDHALEQTHAYHNGAAAFELGIVLATASALTQARQLLVIAMVLGLAGLVFALLGYFHAEWGAF